MFKVDSFYSFILMYKVTNFDIREDPKWKSQTYMKVAQAIGISPTQAYKWGYHYKIKQSKSKAKKRGRKAKPKRNNRVRPSKQSKANIKVLKTNSTRYYTHESLLIFFVVFLLI